MYGYYLFIKVGNKVKIQNMYFDTVFFFHKIYLFKSVKIINEKCICILAGMIKQFTGILLLTRVHYEMYGQWITGGLRENVEHFLQFILLISQWALYIVTVA